MRERVRRKIRDAKQMMRNECIWFWESVNGYEIFWKEYSTYYPYFDEFSICE